MQTSRPDRNNFTRVTGRPGGTIGIGVTVYHPIYCIDDLVTSIQLYWPDSGSNCPVTIEGTNFPFGDVGDSAVDKRWKTLPITVTGPTGTAEDSEIIDWSLVGTGRVRLKIGPAVTVTSLYVRTNGKQ